MAKFENLSNKIGFVHILVNYIAFSLIFKNKKYLKKASKDSKNKTVAKIKIEIKIIYIKLK